MEQTESYSPLSVLWNPKAILLAVVLAVAAGAAGVYFLKPKHTAEKFGAVPEFHYPVAPAGTFGSNDLKGQVWVGSFIFTSCKGICPIVSSKMKRIAEAFAGEKGFKAVSFSIDPERDTLPVLDSYRRKWATNPDSWKFLRPSKEELKAFSDGVKLVMGTVGDFTHTSRLILVDRSGWIRGYYQATDEDQLFRLKEDIQSILEE